MPEGTTAATNQAGSAAPVTATQNTEHANGGAGVLNASQNNSVEDTLKRIEQGLGSIFAWKREMEKKSSSSEPKAKSEDEKTVRERLDEIDRERKELKTSRRMVALKSVATDLKVPASRQRFMIQELDSRLGDKLDVNVLNEGFVKLDSGEPISLHKYVEEFFLKTEDGEMFRSAPATASLPSGGSNGALTTGHPFSSLNYQQIIERSRHAGGIDLLISYQRDHAAEYQAKKAANDAARLTGKK